MKKIGYLTAIFVFLMAMVCFAQEKNFLLIDDFEDVDLKDPHISVDFGAGGGSEVQVCGDTGIVYAYKESLKVKFDAVAGGYIWIARGAGLEAPKARWLVAPESIEWTEFSGFSFYMYGSNSRARVAFDIKDNGNEMWRIIVEDNFKDWKPIACPFKNFFARADWQPDNADKNGVIDFPIKSYQFEPLPESKGTLYFDHVELIHSAAFKPG